VVANGAHSKWTIDRRPRRLMQAIMGWWEGVSFEPHHVEMVFDRMVSPCYGWLFPETPARVNIGICYEDTDHSKNARALFSRFLEKHYKARLAGAHQIGDWKGHPISYSYDVGPLGSPGRLVIGEAGRMTHPATAEGIYQGMRSGMLAAEALRDVAAKGQSERSGWEVYEARCRREFNVSFGAAKIWRLAVQSPLLDLLVSAGQQPVVKTTLARLMSKM
jgi:flavin-dependent dehydrogenase